MSYIPKLDGIRALACLTVMLAHRSPYMRRFDGGWVGVDVFFVLSGYLITSILAREYDATGRISFRHFYWRRALRLLPALLTCVILGGVILALGLADYSDFRFYGKRAAIALAYVSNIFPASSEFLLGHTWSLSMEEQFYLLWPFFLSFVLLKLKPRGRLLLALGLVAFFAALRATFVLFHVPWRVAVSLPFGRADSLMCGAVIYFAQALPALPLLRFLRRLIGPSVAFLVFILLVLPQGPWIICGFVLVEASAASLVTSALIRSETKVSIQNLLLLIPLSCCLVFIFLWLSNGCDLRVSVIMSAAVILGCGILVFLNQYSSEDLLSQILDSKLAGWIGKRSYGIYLYHLPIFVAMSHVPFLRNPLVVVPVQYAVAFGFAWFSYKFIESPFLALKEACHKAAAFGSNPVPAAINSGPR